MPRKYVIADVFTDRAFGGNPLAVVLEADGLDARQMQAIAREFNLSETTFVTRGSAAGKFGARIFTPASELPFAGHPTIGTAVVLDETGATEGLFEIVLEEGIGPVRVEIKKGRATLFMDGAPKLADCLAAPDAVADGLRLPAGAVVGAPWVAGYGVPVLFVPLRDVAAVSASRLRTDAWGAAGLSALDPYVYAVVESAAGKARLRARFYGPAVGVAEDPATGSAAASLAGSIPLAAEKGKLRLSIDQGIEMGRPSRIETETLFDARGGVASVSVGGGAVLVAEGRLLRDP